MHIGRSASFCPLLFKNVDVTGTFQRAIFLKTKTEFIYTNRAHRIMCCFEMLFLPTELRHSTLKICHLCPE